MQRLIMGWVKPFTLLFILTQIGLCAFFIWLAVIDWEESPEVTSVSVHRVQNGAFPAVTLCYPNTWKWPGIIKLLSKLDKTKVCKNSE